MSTGISMSSVNKIKELAENGDYSLALDIMEHQDLSKSLSPQFIRICGEVYYENEKYSEARAALVRAHSMAPVGNKIIYSIIKLYLSMGLWKLADTYFEIYKFNQNAKDAGTYRIEYMIAKAHGKPVNELYSILISANELETDETWDFEMLLLHAYIRNEEKYKSACAEYRANYRKSPHLYLLDRLMDSETDLESMIYCFPIKEAEDDNPADEETRENERKILEEDNLRLHPKDAKIMIMVEDDTPVPSTMKIKQMWQRSKEKKELKRAEREKESEESDSSKSHGLFGRMSRKEEELVDKEIEELKDEGMTREQLLAEVVNKNPDEMPVAENEHEESAEPPDLPEKLLTDIEPDMVEISGELSDVEKATYNNDEASSDTSKEDMEDSFVLEEEPEEVFMIDPDMVEETANAENHDETDIDGAEHETESFDPEFDEDSESGFEPEAEAEGSQQAEIEHEQAVEEMETDNTGNIDFDKAFEALDEFDVESDVSLESDEEIIEVAEEPELSEKFVDEQPELEQPEEIAEAEPEPEQTEEIAEAEPEPEQTEEIAEAEPEPEQTEDIAEAEPEPEQTEDIAEEEPEPEQTEDIAEEEPEPKQTEDIAEAEPEPESTEEILDEQPELEPAEESGRTFTRYQSEKTAHAEFPVFKSSLFPDYNTDGAALYDLHEKQDSHIIEEEEAKISRNLQKEEELLGETDRLLARLGIKLNTEFKSILNFDEDDEQPDKITEPKERSGTYEADRPDKPEDKNTFKLKS